jgi:hypothetical protein
MGKRQRNRHKILAEISPPTSLFTSKAKENSVNAALDTIQHKTSYADTNALKELYLTS